jgi:hypothetical protein
MPRKSALNKTSAANLASSSGQFILVKTAWANCQSGWYLKIGSSGIVIGGIQVYGKLQGFSKIIT